MTCLKAVLSTPTYDNLGTVELQLTPDSDLIARHRRVQSVQTLDGGNVVVDSGFSHGDRSLVLQFYLQSKAEETAVKYLMDNYSELYLSLEEGFFSVALTTMARSAGKYRLVAVIIEKII